MRLGVLSEGEFHGQRVDALHGHGDDGEGGAGDLTARSATSSSASPRPLPDISPWVISAWTWSQRSLSRDSS